MSIFISCIAVRGLDRDPAGVEGDGLADQAQRRAGAAARCSAARSARGSSAEPGADGLEPAHAALAISSRSSTSAVTDPCAAAISSARRGEVGGGGDVGGQVLELAGAVLRPRRRPGRSRASADELGRAEQGERSISPRRLVVGLGAEVAVEAVAGEDRPGDDRGRGRGRRRRSPAAPRRCCARPSSRPARRRAPPPPGLARAPSPRACRGRPRGPCGGFSGWSRVSFGIRSSRRSAPRAPLQGRRAPPRLRRGRRRQCRHRRPRSRSATRPPPSSGGESMHSARADAAAIVRACPANPDTRKARRCPAL